MDLTTYRDCRHTSAVRRLRLAEARLNQPFLPVGDRDHYAAVAAQARRLLRTQATSH